MLSQKIEITCEALSELAGTVDPRQWGLIRVCIQDLNSVAKKVRGMEKLMDFNPNPRRKALHG